MTDNVYKNIQAYHHESIFNPFTMFSEVQVTTASPYTCDIMHIQPHLILPICCCTIFHQIFYWIKTSCQDCLMKYNYSKLKQDFTIIKHFITFKWVTICKLASLIHVPPIFCVLIYGVWLGSDTIYIAWQWYLKWTGTINILFHKYHKMVSLNKQDCIYN